jgi:hypothetical protein
MGEAFRPPREGNAVPTSLRTRLGLLGGCALVAAVTAPAGIAAAAAHSFAPGPARVIPPPSPGPGHGTRVDPLPGVPHARAVPRAGSPWQALANPPPFNPGAMIQLTDGTVLVQDQGAKNSGTNRWWKLTPDASGSYVDGTWSQVASLPTSYAPLYFASAVLPDGRVIIMGGEYNHGKLVWTNRGAVYDPVANTWTTVQHPSGSEWVRIGDGPSTVLANGTFMLGASGFSGTTAEALLNAAKLTWRKTGTGKADGNGEEGWSLLPNGGVLTVDTNDTPNTEVYSPSAGSWTSAGDTPASLIDSEGEVGPQLLQPDGSVFATGATGANAIYNTATGTWSAGPSFPVIGGAQYDVADGPAAVLPDGDVLVAASPGDYTPPTHVFDFNGTTLTEVPDPPNAASMASNDPFMMVLPTGQVLFEDRIGDIEVYNSTGSPKPAWRPSVTTVPGTLAAGGSFSLSGKQLNGLTQAAAYGDDYQDATNYPLVRITNTATGAVTYARTFGMTRMSVAPHAKSSASFTLPAGIQTGASTLAVVANGLASAPVNVTITPAG